jgi:hypothetical protein
MKLTNIAKQIIYRSLRGLFQSVDLSLVAYPQHSIRKSKKNYNKKVLSHYY